MNVPPNAGEPGPPPPVPGPGEGTRPVAGDLPSHRDTALILFAPALVLVLIAWVPRALGESPPLVLALLASITIGPFIAGWIAGGRLAARARALHGDGNAQLHPALLRGLCILGSYIGAFAGCVGAYFSRL